MSKRYSGKSFKDSSVMKKPKLTFKEKRKLKNFDQIVNLVNKKDIVNYFNNAFKENFLKASFLPENER